MVRIEAALAEHAFSHLFVECLGWDRLRTQVVAQHDGMNVELDAVAQKRGFTVFAASTHRTVLANRRALRNIQRQLRKAHHEHILIHYCDTPRKQVWQWATVAGDGHRIVHREHPFFSDQPPPRLLERIRGLEIRLDEEEQTDLMDVLGRVRQVLLPESEFHLFADRPWYAAESDRLAMAVKRGEPGALNKFVEFHIPLARKASRMLIRWFGMDADDAEQTAMIGLLEAARRFDPERGYQFSTYAGYWIRQCCQRYGLEWGVPIRLPMHWFWPCYKMQYVEAELIATYGEREARGRIERELAAAGVTGEQWEWFCRARRVVCFSDVDRPEWSYLRGIAEPTAADEKIFHNELRRELERALARLKPREAKVLQLRFGLEEGERTLAEVAQGLGITRERVRQIQLHAELKLQRLLLCGAYGREQMLRPAQPRARRRKARS